MPRTLLLEIGTEEMPARFMMPALEQLKELLKETLTQLRLNHGQIRTIGTPRRLTAIVSDVADAQLPIVREIRGPAKHIAFDAEGKPTKAAEGFARAQGVAVGDLIVKATDKGEFVFAVKREEGRHAVEVLAEALPQVLRSLSFPKTMRWEESGLRFGRPIRWIVALLGDEVIPFEIAGVKSDRVTYGRRFTEGQSIGKKIVLKSADEYESVLEEAHVVVDHERRRELIKSQVQNAAQSLGGVALMPDELLDEVTFLVEEPVALVGHFDERYLELPAEVLITVMQHHQRYFPVAKSVEGGVPGDLMPYFVFVSNGMPKNPNLVIQGNEKVVTARFEDARFYFVEDRKHRLAEFVPKLNEIVFIEGLGTMADKTERLKRLSTELYGGLSPTLIHAAELCKADLATR
ncbi:MAG: glycine--tRNA ligase subunit beta, partial [Armatimonadota bacterium]